MLKPYYNQNLTEAGCDEVGRGCLAGPVVAAAVILPKNFHHPLLNDSKQLSEATRNTLQHYIKDNALAWAIAAASETEIDHINILQASFLAMHRALDQLSLTPEHILVDGNRFLPYHFIPHTCIVKGDSKFAAIAAASILAKTYRDQLMQQLHQAFPAYHWQQNKGYPTLAHRKAIETFGISPFHRKSFQLLPKK
ncbi:MAG: ribonuclease HII [Chitinophagales bacterium]|nr:ribonuclease HII [Bacteroidota bacterium]MCB9044188.1 ribonuclease HII [Chitinophagales bacterium]